MQMACVQNAITPKQKQGTVIVPCFCLEKIFWGYWIKVPDMLWMYPTERAKERNLCSRLWIHPPGRSTTVHFSIPFHKAAIFPFPSRWHPSNARPSAGGAYRWFWNMRRSISKIGKTRGLLWRQTHSIIKISNLSLFFLGKFCYTIAIDIKLSISRISSHWQPSFCR